MFNDEVLLLTVTDLKQFVYCPRIAYYHTCLPDVRPVTYKMQAGIQQHTDERQRSQRRTMRLDNIHDAQRLFDVQLQSTRLGLNGQLDELIVLPGEAIPVDYKMAKHAGNHFKTQLAAYAMLVEEQFQMPVRTGMIYLIPSRKSVSVNISAAQRHMVEQHLQMIREMAAHEQMPEPTPQRSRCLDCEFRRFCNDV